MTNRALFLDRDGTLVLPRHYPTLPEQLVLYAGLGGPLTQLQSAGLRIIVITNQGGLAHGFFDEAALHQMHTHLATQLMQVGVHLDAIYHCPHHPAGRIPALAIECACRKPQPGLLLQAAADHTIDLARSWFVGDILHDVEAGNRAGCRTVLVNNGGETEWVAGPYRTPDYVASDIVEALKIILHEEQLAKRDSLEPAAEIAKIGTER